MKPSARRYTPLAWPYTHRRTRLRFRRWVPKTRALHFYRSKGQILNSAPTLLRFITSPPVLPLSLFGKATGSLIVYSTRPVPTGQPTPSGWEGKGYWSLPEQVCHLFYPTTPTTGGLDGRPTLERASTHSTSVVVQDLMIRSANICAFCGSAAERRPYASHRGNKNF